MKNLRQLGAGLILTLALATTALAGQMDCPGVTTPSSRTTVADEKPTGLTETLILLLLTVV